MDEFFFQLISTPSVVRTKGEKEVAELIFQQVKEKADFSMKVPIPDDPYGRFSVLGFKRGKSKETVLLLGHLDTVGVDDYGDLSEIAHNHEKLVEALKKRALPDEVRRDLESGNYIFGRGTLDMKSGIYANLSGLSVPSPEKSVLFLAVPDEEEDSLGIKTSLRTAAEVMEKHGAHPWAVVKTDYTSPLPGGSEKERYLYRSTIGKALFGIYIKGVETHAGSSKEGFPPSLVLAEVMRELELLPDFVERSGERETAPPSFLWYRELAEKYTVQTPCEAVAYLNVFFFRKNYRALFSAVEERVKKAVERALSLYSQRTGKNVEVRTVRFQGEKEGLEGDPREASVKAVREKLGAVSEPTVVIFALPPFYPAPEPLVCEEVEKEFVKIVREAGYEPKVLDYYPYISDLSFFSSPEVFAEFSELCPVKVDTSFATEFFKNVPLYNAGPYGKDAHKRFERLEKNYSLKTLPKFIEKIVEGGDGK